jgi:MarR family transcriptional regulator, organic hydroperoxide resistance regulator
LSDQGHRDRAKLDVEDSSLGPDLDFLRLLWAVDHALQSGSKRMEVMLGITGPQRLVLRIVGRFPGIAAGRVAAILHVHPSTLTGILQRLEARGLLQRKADPSDRRRALFALTPKGRKLDTLKTGTVESAVRRALARLPETVAATSRLLAAVAEELESAE